MLAFTRIWLALHADLAGYGTAGCGRGDPTARRHPLAQRARQWCNSSLRVH
jgi:hypothetical protein